MAGADADAGRGRAVLGTALFVLGFSALFAAYGAAFGGLSTVLLVYQDVATRILGILTILLGLLFMGVLERIPLTGRSLNLRFRPRAGIAGAPLFGLHVDLCEGDAQALDFADDTFDTVVCTFLLCSSPNHRRAVAEMVRVLRPGGILLLADHVAASTWPVRAVQRPIEFVTVPLGEEHLLRRPIDQVREQDLIIEGHDRFKIGIVERLTARKPEEGE